MSSQISEAQLARIEAGYSAQMTELRGQIAGLKSVLCTLLAKVERTEKGYRIVAGIPQTTIDRAYMALIGGVVEDIDHG